DGEDITAQEVIFLVHAYQFGNRPVLALLRQLHGNSILQLEIPAPSADADIASHFRRKLRELCEPCQKVGSSFGSARADDQRKIAITCTGKGRNDPARLFDHRKHAALLPYGEGLPLLYAH